MNGKVKTNTDKSKESQSLTQIASQKQSGSKPAFQFADYRPEAVTQLKYQQIANNSTQVQKVAQLQKIINNNASQTKDIIQKRANNTGLPQNLKSGIENLSGYSMDDVKVHYNSPKPAQLQAHAYAQGTNIHLASGQEKHLPHEAWHVVQQKQGRVKPTLQLKGKVNINDDVALEKEADTMGNKALQMQQKNASKVQGSKNNLISTNVLQGYFNSNAFNIERGKDFLQSQEPDASVSAKGDKLERGLINTDSKLAGLLIADDSTMAVQKTSEPKTFFATKSVIANSNSQLANVESPLLLHINNANAINTGNKILNSVVPVERKKPESGTDGEVISLWHHICINFANYIMGNSGFETEDIVLHNAETGEENTQTITPSGTNSPETDRLANYLGRKEKLKKKKKASKKTAIQEEAIEAMNSKNKTREFPGKLYGQKQGKGQLDEKEKALGINKYANAEIGEGYSTFTIGGEMTGTLDYSKLTKGAEPTKRTNIWGYHHAAVVAKSGDGKDQMTLENYNRRPQANDVIKEYILNKFQKEALEITKNIRQEFKEKKQKLTPAILAEFLYNDLANNGGEIGALKEKILTSEDWHKLWYFQMYGPHKGQTFHERQAASGGYVNPLTVRIRRSPKEVAKRKVSTLIDNRQNILKLLTSENHFFYPQVSASLNIIRTATNTLFKKFEGYLSKVDSNEDLVKATTRISNEYEAYLRDVFVPHMVKAIRSVRRVGDSESPTDTEGLEKFAHQKETRTFFHFMEDLSDAFAGHGLLTEARQDANSVLQNITKNIPKSLLNPVDFRKVSNTSDKTNGDHTGRVGKFHELDGTRIAEFLAIRGLSIRDTVKDGNCMYDAIRMQLHDVQGLTVSIATLRQKLSNLINDNAGHFAGFVSGRDVATVANQISSTRSWNNQGGDIAAQSIATVLQRNLIVISPAGIDVRRPIGGLVTNGNSTVASNGTPLTIVYNGGNHYYSTQ